MDLITLLNNRDFAGALTALRFAPNLSKEGSEQWRAFLLFHQAKYDEALEIYSSLSEMPGSKSYALHIAACQFRQRRFLEAQTYAQRGPDCQLKVRLLLHCAAKIVGPGSDTLAQADALGGNVDDQVSLASLHYSRNDYHQAANIYKQLLAQHPDLHALHVYLALCNYMLDDWQSCQEHLNEYRKVHFDSVLAANMRACNEFRENDAHAARSSLQSLNVDAQHSPLMQHNLVVFNGGQNGMQVLPPLVGVIPEAHLNLVVHYLRRGDASRAVSLVKSLNPSTAFEYICKGVACAQAAQQAGSQQLAQEAQHCFEAVGTSQTECDTIPGRQCMACSLLLKGEYGEALAYLDSVKEFCSQEDAFNWNLGMAKAAMGDYAGGAEALSQVQQQEWVQEPGYAAWLARCFIMTGQPELSWQLYLQQQQQGGSVVEILQLIANDCYRAGAFLWAARAFDALEYLNAQTGATAIWDGKRGACVAVFQAVTKGEQPPEVLREIAILLRNSSNPQAEYIIRLIKKWTSNVGGAAAEVDLGV